MRRWIIVLILLVAGAGAAVAAWQFGPKISADPPPTPTVSPSPSSTPTGTTPAGWSTAERRQSHVAGSGMPVLVAVRTGTHGTYDRIALDFEGAAPGYLMKYVPELRRDGSGDSVSMPGGAFLQLTFNPAAAHNEDGQSTLSSPPIQPVTTGYAGLKSYVLAGDYEGYVTIGLGQAGKAGFKVGQTRQPGGRYTIYVDVPR